MTLRLRLSIVFAAVSCIVAPLLLAGRGAAAQQQQPSLPEEVRGWLERDQMQRWAALLQTGQRLYAEGSCFRCHGQQATGGDLGPNLTDGEWVQSDGSLDGIHETIFWGVRRRDFADPSRRFEMNPQGGMQLELEDVRALAAYVWSLSNGTFLPQR